MDGFRFHCIFTIKKDPCTKLSPTRPRGRKEKLRLWKHLQGGPS